MKIDNLKSMSVDELWALHERIMEILPSRISEEKARLETQLAHLGPGAVSRDRMRHPYPPVKPKYRNPKRPSETWSGRGKQPRWLRAQLRPGKKLNDFLIDRSSIKSTAKLGGSGSVQ